MTQPIPLTSISIGGGSSGGNKLDDLNKPQELLHCHPIMPLYPYLLFVIGYGFRAHMTCTIHSNKDWQYPDISLQCEAHVTCYFCYMNFKFWALMERSEWMIVS